MIAGLDTEDERGRPVAAAQLARASVRCGSGCEQWLRRNKFGVMQAEAVKP